MARSALRVRLFGIGTAAACGVPAHLGAAPAQDTLLGSPAADAGAMAATALVLWGVGAGIGAVEGAETGADHDAAMDSARRIVNDGTHEAAQ